MSAEYGADQIQILEGLEAVSYTHLVKTKNSNVLPPQHSHAYHEGTLLNNVTELDHNRLRPRDDTAVSSSQPAMCLSTHRTFAVPQWRIENT